MRSILTLVASATLALSAHAAHHGAHAAHHGHHGAHAAHHGSQGQLPEAVRVPAGHQVMLETVGSGVVSYECRARKDGAGAFEWVFVGPYARLEDRAGKRIGRYYGPPATWEASDGSSVTGAQVAVAPAGAGNLPLQLVKANPASGSGAMQGVSYIQRLATRGGAAPASACGADNAGSREIVGYQADYLFWRAQ